MPRRSPLLAAVAALSLLPATAAAAPNDTYSNFAYPSNPAPGKTAVVTPPVDTTRALNVTISASQPCFFGCGTKTYTISGSPGINWNSARCAQASTTSPVDCAGDFPDTTTITGSALDDTTVNNCGFLFSGYSPNVTISGLGGDDTLNGSCGTDTIDGGDGDDTLNANFAGNDTLMAARAATRSPAATATTTSPAATDATRSAPCSATTSSTAATTPTASTRATATTRSPAAPAPTSSRQASARTA